MIKIDTSFLKSPLYFPNFKCRCWVRDCNTENSIYAEKTGYFYGIASRDANGNLSTTFKIECELGVLNLRNADFIQEAVQANLPQNDAIILSVPLDLFSDDFHIVFHREEVFLLKDYFGSFQKKPLSKNVINVDPNLFYATYEKKGLDLRNTNDQNHYNHFKVFPIQQQAFEHYDAMKNKFGLKLFSFESSIQGKRRYVVSHIHTFLPRYVDLCGGRRHVYEIIREKYPCRLYFDLEYLISHNPTVKGMEMLSKWTALVSWKLYEVYGVCVHAGHVIDLDSSTEEKFSHHLIFILPTNETSSCPSSYASSCPSSYASTSPSSYTSTGPSSYIDNNEILFLDNTHVGGFVRMILDDIDSDARSLSRDTDSNPRRSSSSACDGSLVTNEVRHLSDNRIANEVQVNGHEAEYDPLDDSAAEDLFWVRNKDGRYVRFVDTSVYSRNRVFRLFLSAKHGKTAILRVAKPFAPGVNSR